MQHIGKYKIIKELGAGGFGAVYLAEDPRLGEQVAIKVFQVKDSNVAAMATSATSDAGEVLNQRFLNEAKTLRQLNRNPHIVDVFEFDEMQDGTPYYVMPYLPHSLKDELGSDATDASVIAELEPEDKPKRLPISLALNYLEQLLLALKDVHKVGLVHRDIKPANLLLNNLQEVQLCDFGIAKMPDAQHSQSGVGMGSRNYMAPEQRQSAKHVDARSDIYSAGVLAYRMITGTLPEGRFADPNTFQPALSEELNQLILKALSQHKEQRFADAGEMLKALRQALNTHTESPEDEATGTWIDESNNTASIKAELKPLQHKIAQLFKQQGEIRKQNLPVLQALADIGNLNEDDLTELIECIHIELINKDKNFKALSLWVGALKKQKGKLTQDKQDALIEAGIASTDKTKEVLEAILKSYQKPEGEKLVPVKQTKMDTEQTEKPKRKALWGGVIVTTLFIGVGYHSYLQYQQSSKKRTEVIKSLISSLKVIPSGTFQMGCSNSQYCEDNEQPAHQVTIPSFSMMQSEVTFSQWDVCVDDGGCKYKPSDYGWGRGDRPVMNVSVEDITKEFIPWLNKTTGQIYALPSESQWEYAARAGNLTEYSWGNSIESNKANCDGCGSKWDKIQTSAVKSFNPNNFGLYDMHGNVWEWTQDCWNGSYQGAPVNGSPWKTKGDCRYRALRGGSWDFKPSYLRSASRISFATIYRRFNAGFRLVKNNK
ncbi:bifunctional serine/threonine-protein kinase/formylglycine-generating enzyme family protein [uncultured Paraglaciecola sp.]|uniref:bifunctional serine/threonine-protein kinase/formylglycine-generating enzyme family protein n=1 Tax=uncultured Paraglaciecola sp. TaxID=1765024 RepID=UPI00261DA543|nr:bifunctional serine/threonine-protein kinase/formylglycine-generating enzyme family protein [uncultured Paraglaciecola sp.]